MEGNLLTKTAELAMTVTLQYVREGDFVIDATCGNGHDTLALSKACGGAGRCSCSGFAGAGDQKQQTAVKWRGSFKHNFCTWRFSVSGELCNGAFR